MYACRTLFAVIALAAVCPVHANLLIDGGFEQPAIATASYQIRSSIAGWTGAPDIEIQNRVAGSPFEGSQFVELDTDRNGSLFQDFTTIAGATYRIHFDYSPRPGVAAMSNGLQFFWDDSLYASMALSGIGLSDTAWTGHDLTAVATGSTSRVTFGAFGISDGLGAYLDNVGVTAVPEPATLQILGLGLVILATITGTRRRGVPPSF